MVWLYIFLTITDGGVLLMSQEFRILEGHLSIILRCLRFILEKVIAKSPNPSPKQGVAHSEEIDDNDNDEVINPRQNSYSKGGNDDGENTE